MKNISLVILILASHVLLAQTNSANLLQKAIKAYEKAQYIKAEKIVDRILKQDETYADAYIWKGKCLLAFNEYQKAYEQVEIAINLQPTHAPYYIAMGNLKVYIGQSAIQRAKTCDECGKSILPNATGVLNAKDYYQAALKDYEQAIRLEAKLAEAYYQAGQAYALLGEKEKACTHYEQAAELKHALAKKQIVDFCGFN